MKQPTDSVAATEIIDASGFDMPEFLGKLSLEDLEKLDASVRDKKRIGTSDTAIRAFAEFVPLIKKIQDINTLLQQVWIRYLIKPSAESIFAACFCTLLGK